MAVVTDWLLIGMGVLLVLIALVRIDVQLARFVVITGGLILSGFGCWFRWWRLRREGGIIDNDRKGVILMANSPFLI